MAMECLRCGHCCERYSPLSADPENEPCRHLSYTGRVRIAVCGVYRDRPQQCRDHTYLSSVCPIGRDVLGVHDATALAMREHEIGLVGGSGKEADCE
jgi:hypothetical protein